METNNHEEAIICPVCDTIQKAQVEHTFPWFTLVHRCEKCGYTIMESEWQQVKEPTKQE